VNAATDADLRAILRTQVTAAGGVRAWARANGFSSGTVGDVLSGRNDVSEKIGNRLGFLKRVVWVPFSVGRA
jgi:hypothetical protein